MTATTQRFVDPESSLNQLVAPPIRGHVEAEIELLKEKLLRPVLQNTTNKELVRELACAANEAAALAWFTVCPMLVLPTLLEEKVDGALKHWEKQEQLRERQCAVSRTSALQTVQCHQELMISIPEG